MTDTQLRLRIDGAEDLDAAHAAAEAEPGISVSEEFPPPSGSIEAQVEPVTAVLIAAGVAALAKFVLDWWEKRKGGLVIDQREGAEDEIHRDRDVPWGYVIVFPEDGGEVRIETVDMPKDAIHQLLETVIGGAFTTVTDLADAAKKAVGADKVTTQTA
ncbi:hypothetical protein V2J56_04715 [Georgenia sp. MJ206]|uniref:hypothetical protein n=1 Tax=Georgenia wangjunii TaxID=3117730 RepID=UPI002F2608FE